jgi:hypothetical protein
VCTFTVLSKLVRPIFAGVLSTILMTSCGSSSSFSGGNEKPATKKIETSKTDPVKPTTPSKEDTKKPELDDDTVDTETVDDDIKLPEDAVVKGSFRVWTIPADPAPLQDYQIHIDIKLPSNVNNYTKQDLSGRVTGTDGYQQTIGRDADDMGEMTQQFEALQGRATLVISVPGALNLVKDTININSTILSEEQDIEIVF